MASKTEMLTGLVAMKVGKKPEKKKKVKVEHKSEIMRIISPELLPMAISMLHNNAITKTSENKVGGLIMVDTKVEYPAEVLAAAKTLFDPNRTYKFRLHNSTALAADGSGVFKTTISFPNYASTALEWTALAALFEYCKLKHCIFNVSTGLIATSTNMSQHVWGYNPTNVSTAPTGYSLVSRQAHTKYFHPLYQEKGSGSMTFVVTPIPLEFAQTTSTPYSLTPPSGILGTIDIASYAACGASQIQYYVQCQFDVLFKCRA